MADVVVLLEVTLLDGQKDGFLAKAEQIQFHLAHVPGFVRAERFQSVSEPNKVLSLSVWKDNESVKAFSPLKSTAKRSANRWKACSQIIGLRWPPRIVFSRRTSTTDKPFIG